jgi:hypothetical protein
VKVANIVGAITLVTMTVATIGELTIQLPVTVLFINVTVSVKNATLSTVYSNYT